jgi:phosphatidate cytidylyltransferase
MADADPARRVHAVGRGGTELALRVGSALVLAPLAIGAAYVGGWAFAAFWGIAAIVVFWEWTLLVSGEDRRAVLFVGAAAVVLSVALAVFAIAGDDDQRPIRLTASIIILVMGMLAVAIIAPAGRGVWLAAGVPYASSVALAPIVLRGDSEHGFTAIILLFAVVWGTDIAAYFVGRAVGGPKLAPRFSPNKTWAGAIGGVAAAVVAAMVVASFGGASNLWAVGLIAVGLSVAAQTGDIFESALKRRFGVKDSGRLIPGHGGLMDRLDGFIPAAVLGCAIGLAARGIEAPARGLLMW